MAFITRSFLCLWSYCGRSDKNLYSTVLPREMWKQGMGIYYFILTCFCYSLDMTWMVSVVLNTKKFCLDKPWQFWMFTQWIACKSLELAKLSEITSCLWDVKYCNSCFKLSQIPWKTFSCYFATFLLLMFFKKYRNAKTTNVGEDCAK